MAGYVAHKARPSRSALCIWPAVPACFECGETALHLSALLLTGLSREDRTPPGRLSLPLSSAGALQGRPRCWGPGVAQHSCVVQWSLSETLDDRRWGLFVSLSVVSLVPSTCYGINEGSGGEDKPLALRKMKV